MRGPTISNIDLRQHTKRTIAPAPFAQIHRIVGHEEHIFGQGGGEKMCTDFNIPFLGALPLDIQIRKEVDRGVPTVVADPDGRVAELYKGIARKVAITIAERAKDMSHKFPNIVVQNT